MINLLAKLALMLTDGFILNDVPKLQAVVLTGCMAVQMYVVVRWVSSSTEV